LNLAIAGISFKTATQSVLDAVAMDVATSARVNTGLRDSAGHTVILSTCNRTEIYAQSHDGETAGILQKCLIDLAEQNGVDVDEATAATYALEAESAVRHLFKVAAGLDSMVPGDSEIAGQLRTALHAAAQISDVPAPLAKPIEAALKAAKRVRSEAGISAFAPSVASTALELLHTRLSGAGKQRVTVIGTGKFARLITSKAICAGISDLTIVSRNYERAVETAQSMGANAADISALPVLVSTSDVVISCTSVREPIVTPESLLEIPPDHQVTFLDLSVPASIDEHVGDLDGVTLLGMDDIQAYAGEVGAQHAGAIAQAEEILEEEISAANPDSPGQRLNSVIRRLGEASDSHRHYEVQRAMKNISSGDANLEATLEAMSKAIVKRILADPIAYLKQADDPESHLELFGLGSERSVMVTVRALAESEINNPQHSLAA